MTRDQKATIVVTGLVKGTVTRRRTSIIIEECPSHVVVVTHRKALILIIILVVINQSTATGGEGPGAAEGALVGTVRAAEGARAGMASVAEGALFAAHIVVAITVKGGNIPVRLLILLGLLRPGLQVMTIHDTDVPRSTQGRVTRSATSST